MDHLKKTAEDWDLTGNPDEPLPYMLHTYDNSAIMSWSTQEDMSLEYFPHQIIQALRVTGLAKSTRNKFVPILDCLFYRNDRLYVSVLS